MSKYAEKKETDQEIRKLLKSLEESEKIIVPIDKTDSFISMRKEKYKILYRNTSNNQQGR